MKYFYVTILAMEIALLWIWYYRKEKSIFHPMSFFLMIQFLSYVPSVFINESEHGGEFSDNNILQMVLFENIYLFFVLAGYYVSSKYKINFGAKKLNKVKDIDYKNEYVKIPLLPIIFVYSIGMLAKINTFVQLGGIKYIFNNMAISYAAQTSGFGLETLLSTSMIVAIMAMFYRIIHDKHFGDMIIMFLMCVFYMGSYLIYSSRGPALELILILLCTYSFCVKKINIKEILKPKYMILLAFGMIIAMYALQGRQITSGTTTTDLKEIPLIDMIEGMIDEYSRVGRDIFVYDYFSDTKWYGKIFINLFSFLIPSSIMPNKVPIDDGIYLFNIVKGYDVGPNTGRLELKYLTGIPFTTQGLAYANFGIIGIVVFGLIMGVIYFKMYKYLQENKNPFIACVYFYVIYMFGFTTLKIYRVFQLVAILIVMKHFIIVRRYKKDKYNKEKSC